MTLADDPNLPPRTKLGGPGIPESVALSRRFANFVFDYVAQGVLGILLGLLMAATGNQHLVERLADPVVNVSFGLAFFVAYYVFFESMWGATPGKFLTGTVVVDVTGGKPGFLRIFGRTLVRCVPFEPLSFFFGGHPPLGWHDTLSGTRVVVRGDTSSGDMLA